MENAPQNPPSVWLGVPRSQIPTSSSIQRDIKNTSSTAQNKIDDEMNAFFKLYKIDYTNLKEGLKKQHSLYIIDFFELLSSSLYPCLSQRFSRCTLRPSSGGWNVELNPLFRLLG